MGRIYRLEAPHNNTVSASNVLVSDASLQFHNVTTEVEAEIPSLDLLLPATGLLLSLVLQVLMLFMGQLRRRVRSARLFGWIAYVGADIVAGYTLGLISKSTDQLELYGLWAALLVYHLGGPDNFTAQERADSELWKRHLMLLLIQVGLAVYTIAIHSRGWILAPTLLVFSVGVLRYWERNAALKCSSQAGITKALEPLYKFMESEGEPSPVEEELNYIVAGGRHWYLTMSAMAKSTGFFDPAVSYEKSKPELVTTLDVKQLLSREISDEGIREWAQWLVVASASSTAYLRRVVGLCRSEQVASEENGRVTRLRSLWFDKIGTENWIRYVQTEEDFLYSYLYAKPAETEGNRVRFITRVTSSLVLITSLLTVYLRAGNETWDGHPLFRVSTYVVLIVGALVEIGYVLRLFFSKGAVVASLVHLVKSQRAKEKRTKCAAPWRWICEKLYSVEKCLCVWALKINKFWESKFVRHKKTYLPGSTWEKVRWPIVRRVALISGVRFDCRSLVTRIKCVEPWRWICEELMYSVESCSCVWLLKFNKFWESNFARHKKTYLPGSSWENFRWPIVRLVALLSWVRFDCRSLVTRIKDYMSGFFKWARGWEMVRLALPSDTDCRPLLNGIEASQCDALKGILKRITLLTDTRYFEDVNPGDLLCKPYLHFYDSDWEHVLLIWCLATLKVLSLQKHLSRNRKSLRIHSVEYLGTHFSDDGQLDGQNRGQSQGEGDSKGDGCENEIGILEALWLMVYICHLLTEKTELLPTHLNLTKSLVAQSLGEARQDLRDPSKWVRKAMKMEDLVETRSVQDASSQLALKLVTDLDGKSRWYVLRTSACHFIAMLANQAKLDQHSSQLTQGGELLTTLWILSSHLGGGLQHNYT